MNQQLSTGDGQFKGQKRTAEEILKSQTVGLVDYSEFRKRRAQALEQNERESCGPPLSRTQSLMNQGAEATKSRCVTPQAPKRVKKAKTKAKLSFDDVSDDDVHSNLEGLSVTNKAPSQSESTVPPAEPKDLKRRLGPNNSVGIVPQALTKAALLREAQEKDRLRTEFLAIQEKVKLTEILVPFVFYDGSSIPGGCCQVKKGDHIWLFLDKSRKVGAELAATSIDKSRKDWARIGVDDLMLVRNDVIIPHHYDFYYFILNRIQGTSGLLFDFSAEVLGHTPGPTATGIDQNSGETPTRLEGANDDPKWTKVVDRRWYEKNKHIFPASIWIEFDPSKDHINARKVDKEGNRFFFS